jgi:lactate dehydrogenase-like 2-hydroxyacid dehydrogenase
VRKDNEVKETVICTEAQFVKAEKTFREYGSAYDWISCPEEEEVLAERVREAKARIVVLGVYKYRDQLYKALKGSAGEDPALIARHGVGYDGVDLELCKRRNIMVTITPGTLDLSVAEHTIALMLSLVRDIPALDRSMRDSRFAPVITGEVAGKTLGIAGFGKIGKEVARIASQGLAMKVVAFDTLPLSRQLAQTGIDEEELRRRYGLQQYLTDYRDFAESIDILSIHMPAADQTRGFFNSERLAALKSDAYLINTGRGALIDEDALYDTLKAGKLKAAALDVFQAEPYVPLSQDKDLRTLPNVILTPHVASNTFEANFRVQRNILDNIEKFLTGRYEDMTRIV